MNTQTAVRAAFWREHHWHLYRPGKTQNQYPADVRAAFVDFVDSLARNGTITEALAGRVTL